MKRQAHPVSVARALRARPRLTGCGIAGVILYFALEAIRGPSPALHALIAWNSAALLYFALEWRMMARIDVRAIQDRAPGQDEGRFAILIIVVLAVLAVLLAAGTQLAQVKGLEGTERTAHVALAGLTVVTSWLFMQLLFALHYAHDFYMARHRGEKAPLDFPGTPEPNYADFFHFACVIGTSGQTADINFNGRALRPIGTVHCILAFFFNAALLAMSINLAAGLFS